MGRLKALLDWTGQPLILYQAEQLLRAPVERLIVVLGHRKDELLPLIPHAPSLTVVDNPDYVSGKVSSILAGVSAAPRDDVLLLGVDQPRPVALITRTVDAHRRAGGPITVAGYQGRRGHPVIFSPELRAGLLAITEEREGLRQVLRAHAEGVRVVETDDPLALVNLNTPQDYEAAILLSRTSSERAGNQ
jgi:molybdenum cofactor cytidylyltransferase